MAERITAVKVDRIGVDGDGGRRQEGAGRDLSPREQIMARVLLECYWEWIDAGRPMRAQDGRVAAGAVSA